MDNSNKPADSFLKRILFLPKNESFISLDKKIECLMKSYKTLIKSSLPGFMSFMGALNNAFGYIENYFASEGMKLKIKFKARIKDAVGSMENTDQKPLDDVFGFEIITQSENSERDKEILMALLNRMFDEHFCARKKIHDKSNGYAAFHRIGILKRDLDTAGADEIIDYIMNCREKKLKRQYRDLTRSQQREIPDEELYDEVYLYPTLREEFQRNESYRNKVAECIIKARNMIYSGIEQGAGIDNTHVVEIQFKTEEVAKIAQFGSASHVGYKPVKEDEIIQLYNDGHLIRGINVPFKYQRKNGEMVLQLPDLTLVEMFPFLAETIFDIEEDRRKSNSDAMRKYDRSFAIALGMEDSDEESANRAWEEIVEETIRLYGSKNNGNNEIYKGEQK